MRLLWLVRSMGSGEAGPEWSAIADVGSRGCRLLLKEAVAAVAIVLLILMLGLRVRGVCRIRETLGSDVGCPFRARRPEVHLHRRRREVKRRRRRHGRRRIMICPRHRVWLLRLLHARVVM